MTLSFWKKDKFFDVFFLKFDIFQTFSFIFNRKNLTLQVSKTNQTNYNYWRSIWL